MGKIKHVNRLKHRWKQSILMHRLIIDYNLTRPSTFTSIVARKRDVDSPSFFYLFFFFTDLFISYGWSFDFNNTHAACIIKICTISSFKLRHIISTPKRLYLMKRRCSSGWNAMTSYTAWYFDAAPGIRLEFTWWLISGKPSYFDILSTHARCNDKSLVATSVHGNLIQNARCTNARRVCGCQ